MPIEKGIPSEGNRNDFIASPDETMLVTGANGFIGSRVVRMLLSYGFGRVRCLTRSAHGSPAIETAATGLDASNLEIVQGNLLSPRDCEAVVKKVSVVYHLAAGVDKSYPGCFLNSVVTTRNLCEAALRQDTMKRLVNTSSLAVYSNDRLRRGGVMDESCEEENSFVERFEPYVYGKAKQDELVREYGREKGLHFVLVRPGVVFGPGKAQITGRVGIDTFGVFLHLGLSNRMPFTYVDNCAEAIVLAGLKGGVEAQAINIVDDDLPTSREFLRAYKNRVCRFVSIPIPYPLFYFFNHLWEQYSKWSGGQLPPAFNRKRCAAYWKGNGYSNSKAKELLGWRPRVTMKEGLEKYFAYAHGRKRG